MKNKQLKPLKKFKANPPKKRNPAFTSGVLPGSGGGMKSQTDNLAGIRARIRAMSEQIGSRPLRAKILRELAEEID